jgi:hypothetical protein
MAKFKLQPAPTFKAKVGIHRPGETPAEIEFTFKYRDQEERKEFFSGASELSDIDFMMEIVCGWELEDAFTKDNLTLLANNWMGTPLNGQPRSLGIAIAHRYVEELSGARLGN